MLPMHFNTPAAAGGFNDQARGGKMHVSRLAAGVLCALLSCAGAVQAADAGAAPSGMPAFTNKAGQEAFGNAAMTVRWTRTGDKLTSQVVSDEINHTQFPVIAPFELTFADGSKLTTADLRLLSAPKRVKLPVDPKAARLAERLPGSAVQASFGDAAGRFRIDLQWVQRADSDYLREVVTITALKQDEHLSKVALLQAQAPDAEVVGTVQGSPVVAGHDYFGFEQPLSSSEVHGKQVRLWMDQALPLRKGQSLTYSAVVGATHGNQLRRDFATYLERERAHPYRPFLHYNSWYDIGYFTPYTEAQALDRINAVGNELHVKRGVKLDSFLFDDGWDDHQHLWQFNEHFPHGFTRVHDAAERIGAEPGVWLSPWGGYGPPRQERLAAAKAGGYEVDDQGLALSGPKYYALFHDATLGLLKDYGINQFKLDGTGSPDKVTPGSEFDSDFAAAITLIGDLRAVKPDLFINLTTGTWPSPFWLRTADSIWRGGEDHEFAGVGSNRQRWITYRDADTYGGIVRLGSLYPLNSLMLHGIVYARKARGLNVDPYGDFASEVRSYFASGTGLQELYVSPDLLSERNWDDLAASAKWARAHAETLRDSHWIGGDPARLQVYGWAAWSPGKAIVTLRNPSDRPQDYALEIGAALELPAGVSRAWNAVRVYEKSAASRALVAGRSVIVRLAPFQVLVWELSPAR